jgi:hypothetical protein
VRKKAVRERLCASAKRASWERNVESNAHEKRMVMCAPIMGHASWMLTPKRRNVCASRVSLAKNAKCSARRMGMAMCVTVMANVPLMVTLRSAHVQVVLWETTVNIIVQEVQRLVAKLHAVGMESASYRVVPQSAHVKLGLWVKAVTQNALRIMASHAEDKESVFLLMDRQNASASKGFRVQVVSTSAQGEQHKIRAQAKESVCWLVMTREKDSQPSAFAKRGMEVAFVSNLAHSRNKQDPPSLVLARAIVLPPQRRK